ncbi:hypothetical protein B0H14DRAFT_2973478 [Mycena olivaceomarginata]|nr:hypothetical protein B0H14DRAFT_2973478 [Mycena olivaceomarginata]
MEIVRCCAFRRDLALAFAGLALAAVKMGQLVFNTLTQGVAGLVNGDLGGLQVGVSVLDGKEDMSDTDGDHCALAWPCRICVCW